MQIRLSHEEKTEIERRAAKHHKRPAQFVRDLALQGFVVSDPDASVAAQEAAELLAGEADASDLPGVETEAQANAIEKEATRIYGAEGVPMAEARRRAAQRLGSQP